MKVFKLVAGILCIVISAFVVFQSMAAGLGNALLQNGEVSGSAGIIVALMLLVGGIVMIATRKSEGVGGEVAVIILFFIATFFGASLAGSYTDLRIWAGFCLVLSIVNLVSLYTK